MSEAQSDVAVVDWEGQIDSCPNFRKIDQSANCMACWKRRKRYSAHDHSSLEGAEKSLPWNCRNKDKEVHKVIEIW